MSKIIFVTGGARSGKSRLAEEKTAELGKEIGYIATAKVTDEDMARRIEHHRSSRPTEWHTFEKYIDFESFREDEDFKKCDTFILDCMTILVTNQMFEHDIDYDTCDIKTVERIEQGIKTEVMALLGMIRDLNKNLIIVSNEVGLGLVPSYRLGNLFRDIAGRINQMIAREADEAYFVVSGLPMKLK